MPDGNKGLVVDIANQHSIAYGCAEIFRHSFIRMAHLAEPLMTDGGCPPAVTVCGSEKVVSEYNPMGPVKAAQCRSG